MEAAWGGGGGEPDIPQWLRYGEADIHDALSSNGKLRPDQVPSFKTRAAIATMNVQTVVPAANQITNLLHQQSVGFAAAARIDKMVRCECWELLELFIPPANFALTQR